MPELSNEERQKILDSVTPEELDKAKGDDGVDEYWMVLGAIAEFYGAEMYFAARDDRMTAEEVNILLKVRDKLESRKLFNMAQMVFTANISTKTKNPAKTFKSITKNLQKKMRFSTDDDDNR